MYDFGMSNTQEGASPQGLAPTATQAANTNEIPRAILRALSKPFAPHQVRWRLGNGAKVREGQPPPEKASALAYVDARDCHNRLDAVLGVNWECSYAELRQGKILVCTITIIVGDKKFSRSNGADSTDIEPDMGALSVAFRRAATMFGIGRDLYGYPSPWVKVRAKGKSLVIDDSERGALKEIVAGKCKAWEEAEASRVEKLKAKRDAQPPAPKQPQSAPPEQATLPQQAEAPAEPATDEKAEEKLLLIKSWTERIEAAGVAKDKEKLQAIAKEIGDGPFPQKSPARLGLVAAWNKAMRSIDPNHGKKQQAQSHE